MTAKPIYKEKALLLDGHLVVADLHIGLEHELLKEGIKIPPQVDGMARKIISLLKKSGAKHLVILGDLKHNIPSISWHEYTQVPPTVKHISKVADITIVKGNHDGNIEKMLPGVSVVKSLKIGDSLLLHGHTSVPEDVDYKRIIVGHKHPSIEFPDQIKPTRETAWIKARTKSGVEVIIMPAFNDLLTGTPVNRIKKFTGPVFREIEREDADAYLLDGTHLKLKDLL